MSILCVTNELNWTVKTQPFEYIWFVVASAESEERNTQNFLNCMIFLGLSGSLSNGKFNTERVACLMWIVWRLGCNTGRQQVSRCCIRGEPEESIALRWQSTQERWSILVLKPRADVTKSPKQGCQWPHIKELQKFIWNKCELSVYLLVTKSIGVDNTAFCLSVGY